MNDEYTHSETFWIKLLSLIVSKFLCALNYKYFLLVYWFGNFFVIDRGGSSNAGFDKQDDKL